MSDVNGGSRPDNDNAAAAKQAARDKAGEGAGLVSEKAADAAGTAKDRASEVAGEATAQARDVAGELREQIQDQARAQTQKLAQNVRQLADELGDMGQSGKEDSPATNAVRQLASRGRDVADKLENQGPQGLVQDLQDFARRRPGVFLMGAALAGFATARLGKGAKSAGNGSMPGTGGEQRSLSASSAGDGTGSRAPDERLSGSSQYPPSREATPPTPSYGGAVSPNGPTTVAGTYADRDAPQP